MCGGGGSSSRCCDELPKACDESAGCCEDEGQACVEYIVGECLSDGNGGCMRSLSSQPCCTPAKNTTAADMCCGGDSEKASIDESCCAEVICEEDCCEEKQVSAIPEAACCGGHEAELMSTPTCGPDTGVDGIPPSNGTEKVGPILGGEQSVPPLSHSHQPTKVTATNLDSVQTMRRRNHPHVHASGHKHGSHHEHTHVHTTGKHRHVHKHVKDGAKCATQSAMSRFYEVACCCLINWANRHKHAAPDKSKDACCSTGDTLKPAMKKRSPHKHSHSHHDHSHGEDKSVTATTDCLELGDGKRLTMSLAIEGMDCPSCASKVTRALSSVRSVHDVKVNVFAGQASLAYVEGHTFPGDIAKRATELTGFSCSVIDTVQTQGERSSMRIRIPSAFESAFSKDALPTGITVLSMKVVHGGMLLEVEYNSLVVRPREVLDSFQRWRGEFVPTPKIRAGDVADKELRNMFRRTGLSALLCLPILVLSWSPLPDHPKAYGAVMLVLGAVIQTYIAAPVYSAGFRSLFFQRTLDMDVLIGLSSGIAFAFSSVSYFLLVAGHEFSEPFFETSAILITLIMLGRFISAYARRRATSALDELYSLQVDTVTLVSADSAGTRTMRAISSELVHKGDVLSVGRGAVVPTDGTVLEGSGYVDESCITGESMPVDKSPGSVLTAGTRNGDTELFVRVDRLPSDNTVAEISHLMLEVQNQRLRVQDLADKVASWLAPTILAVGILTFSVWVAVGLRVRKESASTACVAALRYAISVMVVSCPCALVLCVPMVVVISTAVASKSGVLFKSAEAIQIIRKSNAICFDKTGTLSTGVLSVAQDWLRPGNDSVLPTLLALVGGSRHPVSQAIHGHLSTKYSKVTPAAVGEITSLPGQGLECAINGAAVRGGNPRWLGVEADPQISEMLDKALTVFAVSIDGILVAVFGLTDTTRVDARATIDLLTSRKVEVFIVSGDAQPVVDKLAKDLGIPAGHAFGGCLPQDKLARVKELQRVPDTGKKRNVIFVGDGTNDALALAQADVGVSFSTGTSVAASAAGILLLTPSLATAFKTIFSVSTGATRRIWINFGWAFVYNLLAVLGAAGAFVHWSIPPEYAGLGEMVSVVPVVLIAWSIWLLKNTPA